MTVSNYWAMKYESLSLPEGADESDYAEFLRGEWADFNTDREHRGVPFPAEIVTNPRYIQGGFLVLLKSPADVMVLVADILKAVVDGVKPLAPEGTFDKLDEHWGALRSGDDDGCVELWTAAWMTHNRSKQPFVKYAAKAVVNAMPIGMSPENFGATIIYARNAVREAQGAEGLKAFDTALVACVASFLGSNAPAESRPLLG